MYTNKHTEDIAVNLIQQWMEKGISSFKKKRIKARFGQKLKWFKNWNFEYKTRIDDENKTNLENLTKSRGIFTEVAEKKKWGRNQQ